MAPGYGYNLNMSGNPWMQLAQQGLGIFGGSSMGYGVGNFGSLTGMGCGSVFTNCLGEPNYEAMAGYGVISAVLNVGSSAAIHAIADGRASRVDNRAEIKSIDTKIIDKQTEINKLTNEKNSLKTELDEAKSNRTEIDIAATNAKTAVATAQTAYDNALKIKVEETVNPDTHQPYTDSEKTTLIQSLQEKLDSAKADKKKADEAKKKNDEIIEKNPGKIDELTTKIETAQGELEKLEEQRESQYNELSEKDKAKYCQTRFVTCERNETKATTDEEKKEAQKERYFEAKRLVTLYDSNDKAKKEIPKIMYDAAVEYINRHSDLETE